MVLSRVELEIAPVVGNERLRKRKFLCLVNEYLLPVAWKHPGLETGRALAFYTSSFSIWLARGRWGPHSDGWLEFRGLLSQKWSP